MSKYRPKIADSHWGYFWIFVGAHALMLPIMQGYAFWSLLTFRVGNALRMQVITATLAAGVIALYYIQRGLDRIHRRLFG